jgi:hypothetical protein
MVTSFSAFPLAVSKARTREMADFRFLMWMVFKMLLVAMLCTS